MRFLELTVIARFHNCIESNLSYESRETYQRYVLFIARDLPERFWRYGGAEGDRKDYMKFPTIYIQEYSGRNQSWVFDLIEKFPLGPRSGVCLPSTCDSSLITYLGEKCKFRFWLFKSWLRFRGNEFGSIEKHPHVRGIWIFSVRCLIPLRNTRYK